MIYFRYIKSLGYIQLGKVSPGSEVSSGPWWYLTDHDGPNSEGILGIGGGGGEPPFLKKSVLCTVVCMAIRRKCLTFWIRKLETKDGHPRVSWKSGNYITVSTATVYVTQKHVTGPGEKTKSMLKPHQYSGQQIPVPFENCNLRFEVASLCLPPQNYNPFGQNFIVVLILRSSSLCAICSQQVGCHGSPSFSILRHSDALYYIFVHSLMLSVHIVLGLPRPLLPFILPSAIVVPRFPLLYVQNIDISFFW